MKKKILDLSIILLIYIVSLAGGFVSSMWIKNVYIQFFFADVVATAIMYVISLFFKNSSIYDPYWSLVPWIIATYFMIAYKAFSISNIILYIALTLWSWRLTMNWLIVFTDFSYEDWRYRNFRENNNPVMFQFINFTGIMMVPTVLVYFGLMPLLVLFKNNTNNLLSIIGSAIILGGVALELIADTQMRKHLKGNNGKTTCSLGLWNYSRHPNYLGENMIWFGIYIALLVSIPAKWWMGFGTLLMILLFEFISIPLMENRQKKRRPDYLEYIKHTSRMLILPKRK